MFGVCQNNIRLQNKHKAINKTAFKKINLSEQNNAEIQRVIQDST